jgi:hypothetical protein
MKFFISLFIPVIFLAGTVSVKDFKPAFGKWKGTLTYLDYSSGKPYTMPCNISISSDKLNNQRLIIGVEYPDEPKANETDTIIISNDGKMIDGEQVVSNEKTKGLTKIITEKNGVDGNDRRKAVLRHIYLFSKKSFTKRKEVRFEGEENWILRNEYKMTR